jgi:Ala-tRNA(Pro) deacylase
MNESTIHGKLIDFLDRHEIPYRRIEHLPEGRTEHASVIRGHDLRQAAKSIVVMVKHGKKLRKYYLAVVPGDRRVNVHAICHHGQGQKALLAPNEEAELLTGCLMGSVPPISFHDDLHLLVDPTVLDTEEIIFNAARLDVSVAVPAREFFDAAGGTVMPIASVEV